MKSNKSISRKKKIKISFYANETSSSGNKLIRFHEVSRGFSQILSPHSDVALKVRPFKNSDQVGYIHKIWRLNFFFISFCSLRIIGRTSSKDNSDHPLDTATESKMASAVPQEQQRAMSNKLSVSPSFPAENMILFLFPLRERRAKNSRDV